MPLYEINFNFLVIFVNNWGVVNLNNQDLKQIRCIIRDSGQE